MISGPSSYLPTLDEFLAHWAAVNADPLAGTGLVTRDGTTRAVLLTARNNLAAAVQDVENRLNGKEIDRARVENSKKDLLGRSQELGRRLRGILPVDSPYLKAIPVIPAQTSSQEVFLKPLRDLDNLWSRLKSAGITFALAGNYTDEDYREAIQDLTSLYATLTTSELDLKLSREKRNALQNAVKNLLSGYRPAVEGLFPPDSPLVKTLPVIYTTSERTPAAVTATATYDAAANEAVINFTESTDEDLASYELRGVPGPEYDGEDEQVLATLPPGAPRVFRTDFSLSESGTAASFKVYVILAAGNEAGSKPVTVERP
ncbi:MAG: hypothetical protein ACRCXD_00840 [Luteolibacter sp.]